ncbi:hypothetical protein HDU67_004397, partial [Dinochytrium kinnereticum]
MASDKITNKSYDKIGIAKLNQHEDWPRFYTSLSVWATNQKVMDAMTDPFYLTPTVPARPEEETVKRFENASKLSLAINANLGDKPMAMVGENSDVQLSPYLLLQYLNKVFGTGSQISLALMQHKLDEITWIDNDDVTYFVSRGRNLFKTLVSVGKSKFPDET